MVASGFYPTRNGTTAKKVVSSGSLAIDYRRILVLAIVPSCHRAIVPSSRRAVVPFPRVDGIPLIR